MSQVFAVVVYNYKNSIKKSYLAGIFSSKELANQSSKNERAKYNENEFCTIIRIFEMGLDEQPSNFDSMIL